MNDLIPPATGGDLAAEPRATPGTRAELAERLAAHYRRLFAPDQIVELRALDVRRGRGAPHVESGFFDPDHRVDMARAVLDLAPIAKGVYATLNPLRPDLLARRANRVDWAKPGELAADKDVLRRRWLLVDVDPVRDPHVSATDAERAEALAVAHRIRTDLAARGWPGPYLCDSGNGYHLLYRVDLPADDGQCTQRLLAALARQHDTPRAKVDREVYNPSRICKIPGSRARKGDSTPDRPHRWAFIVEGPPV